MSYRRCFVIAAAILSACGCARAQRVYCNVTSIESVRRGNAVQITIRADGIMQVVADASAFFNLEAAQRGDWENVLRMIETVPVRVANARSQVGSFSNVGVYPVSHVEASVPTGAPEGIGLDLRVQLLTPGIMTLFKAGNEEWNVGSVQMPVPKVSMEVSQDQRSIVILVTGERRTMEPSKRRKAGAGDPRELSVTGNAEHLSVSALNADIRELLGRIGSVAHRDMRVDPRLDRDASMALDDVSADDALDAIAATYGLALERRAGGACVVADGDAPGMASYDAGALETVRVAHGSAAAMRNSLPEFLLGYLHVNAGENALTVFGPPPLVSRVASDIRRLDRPVPQIEVTATTVEFDDSAGLESQPILRGTGAFGDISLSPADGGIRYTPLGELPSGFAASLRALESSGHVRVRSEPRSVVASGRPASLFAGQLKYIRATYYNAMMNVYDITLLPVEVGASMKVTAIAGGADTILLGLEPQVSNIVELDAKTGAPTVSTRRAAATIRVRSGETVLVGGLTISQDEPVRGRIPVLGHLPIIGSLFTRSTTRRTNTNLAVFVTARTLPPAG